MQVTNAIKKLNKAGFEVTNNGSRYYVNGKRHVISFIAQESGDITCIKVRHENDEDDMRSDYSAGVFCDNLSQALRIIH